MLHFLCYNIFMIKIADKPWQIMLHTKSFRHSKMVIKGNRRFKRIKKNQKLPPFGKCVTETLIFRSSRSQIIFKIGVLINFAILEPFFNKVAGPF